MQTLYCLLRRINFQNQILSIESLFNASLQTLINFVEEIYKKIMKTSNGKEQNHKRLTFIFRTVEVIVTFFDGRVRERSAKRSIVGFDWLAWMSPQVEGFLGLILINVGIEQNAFAIGTNQLMVHLLRVGIVVDTLVRLEMSVRPKNNLIRYDAIGFDNRIRFYHYFRSNEGTFDVAIIFDGNIVPNARVLDDNILANVTIDTNRAGCYSCIGSDLCLASNDNILNDFGVTKNRKHENLKKEHTKTNYLSKFTLSWK